MIQVNRLKQGGRIDRLRILNFSFNGKSYQGFEGDTLASALLANSVDIVGRSFKYSRPRGIVAAGCEEPNAIIQMGDTEATQTPNINAAQQVLFEGLVATSTKGWPSLNFDLMSYVGKFAGRMMTPGFYYKTFMFPKFMWRSYEKYIRKAAGLGRSPLENDPHKYDHLHHHTDILIVGAGPAGLAAALSAASTGASIIISDEQAEFGGSLLSSKDIINDSDCQDWVAQTIKTLEQYDNVISLPRATVNGYHDHNFLTIHQYKTDDDALLSGEYKIRQRMHHVRAKWVILATGAIPRPLVFANNDVPGCMLASAVVTYINRYSVIPGNKLVLIATSDNGYNAALAWHDAGREVIAIVDTRCEPMGEYIDAAKKRGITLITGTAIIEVIGSNRVKGVILASLDASGENVVGNITRLSCDTVANDGGWSPTIHLSCHTGSRPDWREDISAFVPGKTIQKQLVAGSINGLYRLQDCLNDGASKGLLTTQHLGYSDVQSSFNYKVAQRQENKVMPLFLVPHTKPMNRAPKQFVDFQTDVTAAAIELSTREGFESIEHIKRYTAMGFGTDQGKLGNINGLAIAANTMKQTIPSTGTTIFRPNYTPVSFGAIAGRGCNELFDPKRYTAMHKWHKENNAVFEDVGQWKRPLFYQRGNETLQQAVDRECLATRGSIGILDASTLGKIDIQGKDAREFIGRIYSNAWAKLAIGKCRYGLMCGEDGMVFDDGVTACLADNHFLMFTTTGGAAHVLEWLELYHQTEWPELEVYFNSVTDHWATMTISGPNSRKLLTDITNGIGLDKDEFQFLDWKNSSIDNIPVRIFRISFTGELSYEIHVQANYGLTLWEKIIAAGEKYNITPYGTETMHVLRAEKGFIIAGQDTDGSIHPYDLGMGWCVANKKPYSFIGKRGMNRDDCLKSDRKQFVGLKTIDPQVVIPEGSQAVANPNEPIPMTMLGHITSSYYSACLNHSIALGFIRGGHKRLGERVYYPQADGSVIEAEICNPLFFDEKGERQNV